MCVCVFVYWGGGGGGLFFLTPQFDFFLNSWAVSVHLKKCCFVFINCDFECTHRFKNTHRVRHSIVTRKGLGKEDCNPGRVMLTIAQEDFYGLN